jgi:cellulose synthase operon protein C
MDEIRLRRQFRSSSGKTSARIDPGYRFDTASKGVGEAKRPEKSDRQDLLERRAALLAWLDPAVILDPNEKVTLDDKDLAAVLAACEIVSTADGPRRRLRPDVRRAALKRMGTRAAMSDMLAGLSISSADPIQQMLIKLVKGESIDVEKLDRNELAALLIVIEWMDGILDKLPDPAQVRARLAREDLAAPLRHLAKNFIGREAELDQLRGYLGDVSQASSLRAGRKAISDFAGTIRSSLGGDAGPSSPLFVHGIGGVGKSTLVARFGLELADLGIPFVFLDLDRPHLDPRRPTTLLAEAARQLRVQLPSGAAAAQKLAEDLDSINRNIGTTLEAESISMGGLQDVIEAFCAFARANTSRNLPFIIDTFEVAQSLGDAPVYLMREMLTQLQQGIPNLRPMISGRVLPDQKRFPTEPLPLIEFDVPSAERFLATMLGDKASALDPEAISTAVRSVERTPLALALTGQLLIDHGLEAVRSPSFFGIVFSTKDAAYLYSRVLEHIPPGAMRKLAKPGLVLRRLSPAIIKDVLSAPCELNIATDEQARTLFEDFSRQVSLVEREPGDILRHRPDVRRLMLPALEREVGRTMIRTIDEAAVNFHAQFDEPMFRAEELYHRLRLSDIENFELRWREDVADRLREAMEDFEPQRGWVGAPEARVALSLKLGLTPDPAALKVADLAHWERATARRVSVLLQQGQFEVALKVLHERGERGAASELFRQEAEALMGLSQFAQARAVAEKGVASGRGIGDLETVFENAHLAARASEAMRDAEGARNWLNQATETAMRLGQAEKLLRAALLKSRMENWVTTTVGQDLPSLLPAAQNLLKWNAADGVTSAPTLRALAAAAGEENTIRRAVLRRLGVERLSPALREELAVLIARIAGGGGISAQSVRAILATANEKIPEVNATAAAWSGWLTHTSGSALGNALVELSKEDNEYGVTADVMNWIIRYFREIAAAPEAKASVAAASA